MDAVRTLYVLGPSLMNRRATKYRKLDVEKSMNAQASVSLSSFDEDAKAY